MSTVRVGVVADTHVGEFLDTLPGSVFEALRGCSLILHAGDLSVPSVLTDLERIAPVVAVRGDHDRVDGLELPETAVVVTGGRRIGLVHGRRRKLVDASIITAGVLAGRDLGYRAGLHRSLVRRLGRLDCVVYGHWHEPVSTYQDGVLMFSPGTVCPWGSLEGAVAPRTGLAGVEDRAVRRWRWQLGPEAMRPSVGVLEIGSSGIRPSILPLPTAAAP